MDTKLRRHYEARASILKALSHPTRLFLVDQLCGCERCVCELTEMVGHDISTVSKHLSILKNAGIVAHEKRGTQVFYSLRIPCVLGFLSCAEKVLRTNVEELAALAP